MAFFAMSCLVLILGCGLVRARETVTAVSVSNLGTLKKIASSESAGGLMRREDSASSDGRTVQPDRDCQWGQWSDFSKCSKSCEGGTQKRQRVMVAEGTGVGVRCSDSSNVQVKACNQGVCPVDCEWSPWSAWSACTKKCAGGDRSRTHSIAKEAIGNGAVCGNVTTQIEPCNVQACPVDCQWEEWGSWTNCTKTCGKGEQERRRGYVTEALHGGQHCEMSAKQGRLCNVQCCPVACVWGTWLEWSSCSVTCNSGQHMRMRNHSVVAKCGGLACAGVAEETKLCQGTPCPFDCAWHTWTAWGGCVANYKHRTRIWSIAMHGGAACTGPGAEQEWCGEGPAPAPAGAANLSNFTTLTSVNYTSIGSYVSDAKVDGVISFSTPDIVLFKKLKFEQVNNMDKAFHEALATISNMPVKSLSLTIREPNSGQSLSQISRKGTRSAGSVLGTDMEAQVQGKVMLYYQINVPQSAGTVTRPEGVMHTMTHLNFDTTSAVFVSSLFSNGVQVTVIVSNATAVIETSPNATIASGSSNGSNNSGFGHGSAAHIPTYTVDIGVNVSHPGLFVVSPAVQASLKRMLAAAVECPDTSITATLIQKTPMSAAGSGHPCDVVDPVADFGEVVMEFTIQNSTKNLFSQEEFVNRIVQHFHTEGLSFSVVALESTVTGAFGNSTSSSVHPSQNQVVHSQNDFAMPMSTATTPSVLGYMQTNSSICLTSPPLQRGREGGSVYSSGCDTNASHQDQFWEWMPHTGHIKHKNSTRCLQAPVSERNKTGGNVYLYTCDTQEAGQQWEYNAATGQLRLLGGSLCLDVSGRAQTGMPHLMLCDSTKKDQAWLFGQPIKPSGHIRSKTGGLCIDANEANTEGGKIWMWTCDQHEVNQQWVYDPDSGRFSVRDGLCLDAHDRASSHGKIAMHNCLGDNLNQYWDYDNRTGQIKNRAGLCLDTPAPGISRAWLQTYTCDISNTHQQWVFELDIVTSGSASLVSFGSALMVLLVASSLLV